MLIEIQCDKFKVGGKNGETREPIHFHKGLNAIVGDDDRSNSIGKSTLLMIIDFVFGGEDYIKKCLDVHAAILEHTINFTFRFRDQEYSFARATDDYMFVVPCTRGYEPIKDVPKMHIDDYRAFLAEKYGIDMEGLTWRGLMSKFIRVYRRDTMDAERPLQASKDESVKNSVISYMKQFKRYAVVKAKVDLAQKAEEERSSFKVSVDRGHIRMVRTDKEFETNKEQISALEQEENELAENSNRGLLDLDSIQAQQISSLDDQIASYSRQRARVQSQLNAIRREMTEGKKSFKRSYDDLARFFPNEEFAAIEQVDNFHRGLSKVLAEEFKESERELSATYVMLCTEIDRLKKEKESIKSIPNVTRAVLKRYAEITTSLNNAKAANENYETYARLKAVAEEYAKDRDNMIAMQVSFIEQAINTKMREITTRILHDADHIPPNLSFEKLSKYKFETHGDGGSGTQSRGLITFDLANMDVCDIPFVVHDADLMDPIEKTTLTEIVREYARTEESGKQVFVSFRSFEFYAEDARPIIEANTVLQLATNGNQLFGWAWNKDAKKGESNGNEQ